MVDVTYRGDTSNQIIEWMFGYMIAKEKGYCLNSGSIHGFSKIPYHLQGNVVNDNLLKISKWGCQNCDLDDILNHNGKVLVDSFLQQVKFFQKYLPDYQRYVVSDYTTNVMPNDNDLTIHLRLGDYEQMGINLPFEFYEWGIKNLKYDNYILVTDSPYSPIIQNLLSIGSNVRTVHQDKYRDFDFIQKSKNVLISQSSYSWLASWTGLSENIYSIFHNEFTTKCMWKKDAGYDDIVLTDDKIDKRFKNIYL